MIRAQEFQLPVIGTQEQVDQVTANLRALPGVVNVVGHRPTKIFAIQWSDPANWEQIEKTLIEMGYSPKYK
jgi:hypothetical protein